MGSHHSHEIASEKRRSSFGPRGGSKRGQDNDKSKTTSMVPIEKLAKLLMQRCQKEGIHAVAQFAIIKYLFPRYGELARRFYAQLERAESAKNEKHDVEGISSNVFRHSCEALLSLMGDEAIVDTYVRMFSSEKEGNEMCSEDLRNLLLTSYRVSIDHHPEGPQTCPMIDKTLSSVVDGCFGNKDTHSVGFVVRWLLENCPRIILPLHRYTVHILTTRYRDMESLSGECEAIELPSPVLERPTPGLDPGAVLGSSGAWLAAACLPPLYSKAPAPPPAGLLTAARLAGAVPYHWTPLYRSRDHGLAANRFLHHTLAYRGPTLVVVETESGLVGVIASPTEWRETHLYWGGPDCAILQLYPTLSLIERGPKLLYLNTSIRGHPRGLRAGADPRAPSVIVDDNFAVLTWLAAPHHIASIEVWGCGDTASRETQLDIKKWQVKEAERQRQVKLSAAEWMEHPDRYLLEMAGRPQYNNSSS